MSLFIMAYVYHKGSERTRSCLWACLCPAQQPSFRIFLYSCHGWILFFHQHDGTGLPSCYSITTSSIPANLLQLEGEETKHFPLAKDFEERFLLASLMVWETGQEFSGLTAEFHLDSWHPYLLISHLKNGLFFSWELFTLGEGYPDQTTVGAGSV